jgi:hypothetical protein
VCEDVLDPVDGQLVDQPPQLGRVTGPCPATGGK